MRRSTNQLAAQRVQLRPSKSSGDLKHATHAPSFSFTVSDFLREIPDLKFKVTLRSLVSAAMKDIGPNLNFIKTPAFIKITAFGIIVLSCFYLGKHYSDGYQQLSFFSTFHSPQIDVAVGVSPNVGKFSDQNLNLTAPPSIPGSPPNNSKNAPPPAVERIGIVDEDGAMSVEFEVGEFDPHSVEDLGNSDGEEEKKVGNRDSTVKIENFRVCEASMQDYIPCLDNVEEIARLNSTERGEKYERHCPGKGEGLDCLVPMPQGYKPRIPWPASRDEVI